MDEPNILVKTALSDAVRHVNSGMTPTASLKKVAEEYDLNPNYIQRTGEALNVALHYKHFKSASDRSQDFEIADIPSVVQDVFTFSEKTASEKISEQFSVSDANETIFNYNRVLSNPAYKRAFMEIDNAPEKHDSYPTSFRTIYEKSANYVGKLQKQAEEAEVARVEAELDLNTKFSELSDSFRRDIGYRTSFEEFESQVFSKHGSVAVPYIDLLHKTACPQEERGVHDSAYIMFEPCKEAQLFDSLMKAAAYMLETEKQAEEISENLKYEQDYLKEAHKALGKQAEEDSETDHLSSAEKRKEDREEKEEEECEDCDPVLAAVKKAADSSYSVVEKYAEDPVHKEYLEKEAFFRSFQYVDVINASRCSNQWR